MNHTWVSEWHSWFKAGWRSTNDDKHTGRPITSTMPETVAKIQQFGHEDQCRTIRDFADEVETDYETCHLAQSEFLTRWQYQAQKFWIPPRILTASQEV